jgi:hypothetical protein
MGVREIFQNFSKVIAIRNLGHNNIHRKFVGFRYELIESFSSNHPCFFFTPLAYKKFRKIHQSLVGSVVIDAELGREDHGSIPHNCDREGAGTT